MKWQGRRSSRNIEDRRKMGGGKAAGGGLGVLAIVVIGYFLGVDTSFLLDGQQVQSGQNGQISQADQRAGEFAAVTLADTETIWAEIFATQVGDAYVPPTLVLFKGATNSPCGGADGASGPFYCPADRKAYLDTDFFVTMEQRLGAGGDFAAAYVIAHEVAHHVQNELGILGQANRIRAQASERDANLISVRLELQADCYSGIWARYAQERLGTLERGDLQEALNAAKQIGDDTLQRNAGKRPNPHTFTHGTSDQRQRWFAKGYETADLRQCDTFGTNAL
ncbi:neutral zinc metallopeptidase [Nereida sp. MMG025]|uniref:KPN_02809 family neutral zinc metallopeptidase n=1 Tax=Nereida sp. MMG025 TaxID=2909981 RepID=UPI001F1E7380|nr:neutral zinc metallopeptidase [Nereida sp. MMG025]MCF6445436.1 neutral zinc metallopeptidase [Nereida sp. MMG025]